MSANGGSWSEDELRRRVGQLFIVGFHAQEPDEHIEKLIREYHVGNIILFQRNVQSATQLAKLTSSLQQIARDAGHEQPLFISIDQENGLVTRIKPQVAAQLPGAMTLAATGSTSHARDIAAATAETLTHFGINMNYGPVADTNSEPRNPVIGVRSPSDDPETVGRFVAAQIQGFRDERVVSCIKHFPGHGDTVVDSHHGLPVIQKSQQELEECELVPFRRAVAEGVESVMTAHIALPQLGDGQLPASLSKKALDILRQGMRYDGLVISDCLEMDGVRASFGTERAAVMALKAGTDSIMVCHTLSAQTGAIETVIDAVKSGNLSQEDIEKAFQRVYKLKSRYLVWDKTSASFPEEYRALVDRQLPLAKAVYKDSVTVVRIEKDALPLGEESNIVYVYPSNTPWSSGAVESGEAETGVTYTPQDYIKILRQHNPHVRAIQFFDGQGLTNTDVDQIKRADAVILTTRNAQLSQYQRDMGFNLAHNAKVLVVIAICDPYDFLEDEEIKNYVTIYEPTSEAFSAAAEMIFGKAQATGTLPVAKPRKLHKIEPYNPERDLAFVARLWNESLPNWNVKEDRLGALIERKSATSVVVRENDNLAGFCLGYQNKGGLSKLTCVLVSPPWQGQGIGTALVKHMKQLLTQDPESKSLSIGSVFPRFWPGLPLDLLPKDEAFFTHRGFILKDEKTPRDLFQDIRTYTAPAEIMKRAADNGITFAPMQEKDAQECLEKQRKNFNYNEAWVSAYEYLVSAKQYHEIMVAFDSSGAQVGWTLMSSPDCGMNQMFAFLPLVAESGKTGLIACVGVDKEARKGGIGIAMLCSAIEDMKRRGLDSVFIDWVVIRGFYEKLGFEVWREYHAPHIW